MKVAVIGGRDFCDYELVKETLSMLTISSIISGGAYGADTLGEKYAKENNIPTTIFLPDWEKHGKKAGFLRNTDIVNESELVVAFWNGFSNGTKDTIRKAREANKKVLVIPYESKI